MIRRICQFGVALALVIAVGGHWVILQSAAWVGMTINYAREASLADAVRMTFDGQHPCKLCKVVEQGKKAEKKQDARTLATKLDLICLRAVTPLHPHFPFHLLPEYSESARHRSEGPPSPPPRAA